MSENLMNSAHKASTPEYRDGWDRIFGASDASDNRITGKMIAEYLAHPSFCPFCSSADISAGRIDVDMHFAWLEVDCETCGEAWREVFELAYIEEL